MSNLHCLGLLAGLLLFAGPGHAAFVPAHDDVVLERLPTAFRSEDRALRTLRAKGAEVDEAVALARRYVDLGRRSGDPRHHGRAAALLRPWAESDDASDAVLVLRATLRQHRHDFDGALADLDRVLARSPRHATAWFTKATVLQVQGRLPAAWQSCLALLRLEGRSAQLCLARVGAVSGAADESLRALRRALARPDDWNPDLLRFAWTTRAEIAHQLGEREEAERAFREALGLGPPDLYLLGAYADFLLDVGRADEVLRLETEAPGADAILLRRALARRQLGAATPPEAEREAERLAARYRAARRRGAVLHAGDEARFLLHVLDRPDQALALAARNFEVQREPRDLRILLEAAIAAGRPAEAAPALALLRASAFEGERLEALAARVEGLVVQRGEGGA